MSNEAGLRSRCFEIVRKARPRVPLAVTLGLLALNARAFGQTNASIPTISAAPPAPIAVTVDGAALYLPPGVSVTAQNGRVLVPLREIFERLGAKVKFDAPTHSIIATKDATHVILQLGDTTAIVDGTPRVLSTPAQIVGTTTMVPLRFVSEALGAKVKWSAANRTVRIITAEALAVEATAGPAADAARAPNPPVDSGTSASPATDTPVTGTLTAIDATTPTVTVHTDMPTPMDLPVLLTPDARILGKRGDDPAVATTLAQLRTGDQVVVRRNKQGFATDIEADYVETKGAIKMVAPSDNGTTRLTLADDSTVDVTATAPVTLSGNAAALTDLKIAMVVTARVNPTTKQVLAVAALPPEVKITGLTVTGGDKTLTATDTVSVTLVGTPGGKATVTAAGIASVADLPLTESPTAPGTYTGTFPVPPGYTTDKSAVTGELAIDPTTAPVFTSPTTLTVDSQPPTISNVAPADQSTVSDLRPDISGDLDDKGTGIDPTTFQLRVNDKDVTAQVKLTKNHFLFHPTADLPPGTAKLSITIKDKAGNVAQEDALFSIIPAVSPLKVVTVLSGEDETLQASDVVKIRAEATPGGTAKFGIGPKGLLSGAMTEEQPGIYTGTYTVQRGDSLVGAPVTVTFTPPGGGDPVTKASLQVVNLSAGPPVAPIVDQPLEGSATGSYLTVSGHGTPNSTVRLTIAYKGKVIVLKKSGSLTSLDLPVGRDGTWTTDLLTLDTGNAGSVSFTATAITILKDGEMSAAAVVRFKK